VAGWESSGSQVLPPKPNSHCSVLEHNVVARPVAAQVAQARAATLAAAEVRLARARLQVQPQVLAVVGTLPQEYWHKIP
jgi:hypothetical protein